MFCVLLRTAAAAAVLCAASLGSPPPASAALPLDACHGYCLGGAAECMTNNNGDAQYCATFFFGCYASCTTFFG